MKVFFIFKKIFLPNIYYKRKVNSILTKQLSIKSLQMKDKTIKRPKNKLQLQREKDLLEKENLRLKETE